MNILCWILKYIGQNQKDYGQSRRFFEDFGLVEISQISLRILMIFIEISTGFIRIKEFGVNLIDIWPKFKDNV